MLSLTTSDETDPRWASYSLGVFLCIRCASLHRKMGTHVSKVKSCSMDCWTMSEIQNMKNLGGNSYINSQINPNSSSNLPIALDDDHVMERYIRDKWERKRFAACNSNHSTPAASQEDLCLPSSPSSTNSSLVSSPLSHQQQHVFAGRHVAVESSGNPFLVNPFAGGFQAQKPLHDHHHKHVISTTPTFPLTTATLTTNPFLQQQQQQQQQRPQSNTHYSINNPFVQNPY
ncbi:hypothetical protein [Parasitella parasitica]|uniref:Arf-GAP domain-containing protein n=1 Tax=Parasitella parasitica TaxID=35722 RepID=A0A0B7NDQ2_9FUNG|nr:hypothetical protein [Parasitella parasitica]